jgi:hypothetical protein
MIHQRELAVSDQRPAEPSDLGEMRARGQRAKAPPTMFGDRCRYHCSARPTPVALFASGS